MKLQDQHVVPGHVIPHFEQNSIKKYNHYEKL